MQRFVYFVMVFALSLAKDVYVYNSAEYYNSIEPLFVYESAFPWKFGFKSNSRLNMEIRYRNKSPDITAVSASFESGVETIEVTQNVGNNTAHSDGSEVFMFERDLSDNEVKINVQIKYDSYNWCPPKTVARARKYNNITKMEYRDIDICLKMVSCVLVVDLKNFGCHERRTQKPKIKTTSAKTFTGFKNDQNNIKAAAPKSPHEYKGTETKKLTANVTERRIQKPKIKTVPAKTFTGLENQQNTNKAAAPKSPHKYTGTETTKFTAEVTSPTIVTQKTDNFMTTTSIDLEKNSAFDYIVTLSPLEKVITMTNSSADKTETAEKQPSILIYVIPPVLTMSVLAVVVYIIVKKHRHRNSHPVGMQELNAYATPNEVVYADLSLANGDSKPPRRDQETPYAQIIGVMRPVNANIKNK